MIVTKPTLQLLRLELTHHRAQAEGARFWLVRKWHALRAWWLAAVVDRSSLGG